jgi:hypothetical protein
MFEFVMDVHSERRKLVLAALVSVACSRTDMAELLSIFLLLSFENAKNNSLAPRLRRVYVIAFVCFFFAFLSH